MNQVWPCDHSWWWAWARLMFEIKLNKQSKFLILSSTRLQPYPKPFVEIKMSFFLLLLLLFWYTIKWTYVYTWTSTRGLAYLEKLSRRVEMLCILAMKSLPSGPKSDTIIDFRWSYQWRYAKHLFLDYRDFNHWLSVERRVLTLKKFHGYWPIQITISN